MNKLLTISVASYNIEPYIDKLMESIIASDVLDKIEVLIVNDGSTDHTAQKAAAYQAAFPNTVRLISKANGGHGSTINRGIEEATGTYFRALDGDDWINPTAFQKLVNKLDSLDVDLILSDYCKCYSDGRDQIDSFDGLEGDKIYQFDEIAPLVKWMRYHTVIYRTQILKDHKIKLDENCFYVDTEFMLFPIRYVNTIYYFNDYIYCYRLGTTEQSVSPESRRKHIANSVTVANSLLDMCNKEQETLSAIKKKYIISGIANHCIWHIQSLLLFSPSKQKKQELVTFEKYVRNVSNEVYQEMGSKGKGSRLIHILRKSGYFLYPVASIYKRKKMK